MMDFVIGLTLGAVAVTAYYVYQAVQELQAMDAAEDLAEIINFPFHNNNGDYE